MVSIDSSSVSLVWKFRLACLAYCLLLTTLLLMPNPVALLGLGALGGLLGGSGVHFAAFFVLGLLVPASRFPLRVVLLASLLLLFAVGAELLQLLNPSRTVDVLDLLGNLIGMAVGVALGLLTVKWKTRAFRDAVSTCRKAV